MRLLLKKVSRKLTVMARRGDDDDYKLMVIRMGMMMTTMVMMVKQQVRDAIDVFLAALIESTLQRVMQLLKLV